MGAGLTVGQAGRETVVRPDEPALYDSWQPFRIQVTASAEAAARRTRPPAGTAVADGPGRAPHAAAAAARRLLHPAAVARRDAVPGHGRRRDLADPALRDMPVHRIADRWGFKGHPTFTRAFRAAFGTTPQDYRNSALAAAADERR
ncbi:helix-turn-helix domain-containing protein [Streptomyces griseofuscus]|uniref:helix-turn-helix domain-containing protein n=1 Tax=Streptomyces griseofuscus TaxID=146922 RepID=UPI0038053A53